MQRGIKLVFVMGSLRVGFVQLLLFFIITGEAVASDDSSNHLSELNYLYRSRISGHEVCEIGSNNTCRYSIERDYININDGPLFGVIENNRFFYENKSDFATIFGDLEKRLCVQEADVEKVFGYGVKGSVFVFHQADVLRRRLYFISYNSLLRNEPPSEIAFGFERDGGCLSKVGAYFSRRQRR